MSGDIGSRDEMPARGEAVRWNGTVWRVELAEDRTILLCDVISGRREPLKIAEWLDGLRSGVFERRVRPPRLGGNTPRRGAFMRWGQATWRVHVVRSGVINLQNIDTQEVAGMTLKDWHAACFDGRVEMISAPDSHIPEKTKALLSVPIENLPESMRNPTDNMAVFFDAYRNPQGFYARYLPEVPEAERRFPRYLSKKHLDPFLALVAEKTGHVKPGSSTFCVWLKKAEAAGGDIRAGAPRHDLKGPNQRYMPPRVQQWLHDAVDTFWLRELGNTKKKVFEEVKEKVTSWNEENPDRELNYPSEPHVARYIRDEVDQYVAACRRLGREEANRLFKQKGQGVQTTFFLERVEADHTFVKIRLKDDATGAVLGYPWVTAALDHNSRMPLALHVNFENQSLGATFQCLKMVMSPKGFLTKLVPEIDYEFPFGRPWSFYFDRGSDFTSKHILRASTSLSITMDFEPVGCPEFKGTIERWWRTLKEDVVYGVPGARRAGGRDVAGVDADGEAYMTYSEFVRRVWLWASMVYAKSYHRGIDDIPLRRWRESASVTIPRSVPKREDLNALLNRVEMCIVSAAGVTWNGLTWVGPALTRIMTHPSFREGMQVGVRIDEYDVSQAWVVDPFTRRDEALVPKLKSYMTGLSLHAHGIVQKNIGKASLGEVYERRLIATKKKLRDQERAHFERSARTGKPLSGAVTKFAGIGAQAPSGDDPGDVLAEGADLEAGWEFEEQPDIPAVDVGPVPPQAQPMAPPDPQPGPGARVGSRRVRND